MNRPTIALACILKDELKNLPQLLASVEGCFDEVHLCDTGSTDGSIEWIKEHAEQYTKCPVILKHFTWCDDFAKARNASMEGVKTDYVMWMDLDDVLSSKEEFKKWRDHVMVLGDFWLAPYYYAFENEKPICNFIRERVAKTSKKFEWKYPIHEGMIALEPVKAQYVNSWQVHHKRTSEDYEKDFTRNVTILEKLAKQGELPTRLKFYYAKELFDKQKVQEAYVWFDQILDKQDLEQHDRILTFEYFMRCCLQRYHQEQAHQPNPDKTLIARAIAIGGQALTIAPTRAEFYCMIGDCRIIMDQHREALPMYAAAKNCPQQNPNDAAFLFTSYAAYTFVPRNQIARILFQTGNLDGAIKEAKECLDLYGNNETLEFLNYCLKIKEKTKTF